MYCLIALGKREIPEDGRESKRQIDEKEGNEAREAKVKERGRWVTDMYGGCGRM
jgi:hypothetical protein